MEWQPRVGSLPDFMCYPIVIIARLVLARKWLHLCSVKLYFWQYKTLQETETNSRTFLVTKKSAVQYSSPVNRDTQLNHYTMGWTKGSFQSKIQYTLGTHAVRNVLSWWGTGYILVRNLKKALRDLPKSCQRVYWTKAVTGAVSMEHFFPPSSHFQTFTIYTSCLWCLTYRSGCTRQRWNRRV